MGGGAALVDFDRGAYPLHQTNQIFRNLGDGSFEETTPLAGEAFEHSQVSRGVAVGDVDNDGDVDLLVANNGGRARLLLNQIGQRSHWLGARLLRRNGGSDALGARVALYRPGERVLWRRSHTDGSYASASDPRVLFGLGASRSVSHLQVRWPGGAVEEWRDLAIDRYITLVEGRGTAVE